MSIRPATQADIPAIARVHVDSWRSSYRGIVPDHFLDSLTYANRERMWQRVLGEFAARHVVHVAEDAAVGVVGFALGATADEPGFDGEVQAIYLLSGHQGVGIGRRLMVAAAEELAARGLGSLIVWVLAENPARRFYEALGGRYFRARSIELGGESLQEVSYGWDRISALLATSTD